MRPLVRRIFWSSSKLALATGGALAIGWGLVRVTADYVATEMTRRAAPATASVELSRAADLSPASLEPLVSATTSPHDPVAAAARRELTRLARKLVVASYDPEGSEQTARDWRRLLDALRVEAAAMPPASRKWAARTVLLAIDAARQMPPEAGANVVLGCDLVTEALAAPPVVVAAKPPARLLLDAPPEAANDGDPAPAELDGFQPMPERTPEPLAPEPISAALPTSPPGESATPFETPLDESAIIPPGPAPSTGLSWSRPTTPGAEASAEPDSSAMPAQPPAQAATSGPEAEVLADRELLAAFVALAPRVEAHLATERTRRDGPRSVGPQLPPPDNEVQELLAALQQKGYQQLSFDIVREVLAESPSRRQAIVDTLSVMNDAGSGRLLLILAQDASADVRLAAITILASGARPEHTAAALRLAIRDPDPRIADLARTLRAATSGPALR